MINENWALLCEAGFWGWTTSAAGFLLASFPARGVFRGGSALRWGGALVVFFSLWIVGMLKA